MKTIQVLLTALILWLFVPIGAIGINNKKKYPPSLDGTSWGCHLKGKYGKYFMTFTFSSDSSFLIKIERNAKDDDYMVRTCKGRYQYNSPNKIVFHNTRFFDLEYNPIILNKGIIKNNKIEIFTEDQSSFTMTKEFLAVR